MFLTFTAETGESGKVTDEFDVEFDGPQRPTIEEHVREALDAYEEEHDSVDIKDVFGDLVLSLPEETPVRSAEIQDGATEFRQRN